MAVEIADVCIKHKCRYGAMACLLTDRAPCLVGNIMSELSKLLNIARVKTCFIYALYQFEIRVPEPSYILGDKSYVKAIRKQGATLCPKSSMHIGARRRLIQTQPLAIFILHGLK